MALDRIAEDHGFTPWKSRFQGKLADGQLGRERVMLLKPETFMNLSGNSVSEAVRFYKFAPEDVIVFHDELDLVPGKAKFKIGGGHAGHNGLRSIHSHLGENYGRVRLGIGHPGRKEAVSGYVLHDFARADADWLDDLLRGVSDGAPYLAAGDGGKFANAVALRTKPPRKNSPPSTAPTPADASTRAKTPTKAAKPVTPPPAAPDTRTALQKLADHFK
jgi:PTH1 family peptidyl-tRNA hydrolase